MLLPRPAGAIKQPPWGKVEAKLVVRSDQVDISPDFNWADRFGPFMYHRFLDFRHSMTQNPKSGNDMQLSDINGRDGRMPISL